MFYAEVQLEAEVLDLMAESFSDCSLESLQVYGTSIAPKRAGGGCFLFLPAQQGNVCVGVAKLCGRVIWTMQRQLFHLCSTCARFRGLPFLPAQFFHAGLLWTPTTLVCTCRAFGAPRKIETYRTACWSA